MAEKASPEDERVLITREELQVFFSARFSESGSIVVAADYRGHFSHGLHRLEYYMKDLLDLNVSTRTDQGPEVVRETADGHNLLGLVVGTFAMDLAIKKAREAGIGWVSVKGTSHFGIAGWYSMRAQQQGLVAEGETEELVPGDPERKHMTMCDERGGIPYSPQQIQGVDSLSKKYGVDPLVRLQV